MTSLDDVFETKEGRDAVKFFAELDRKHKRGQLSADEVAEKVADKAEEVPEVSEKIFPIAESFSKDYVGEKIIERVSIRQSEGSEDEGEFDEEDAKEVQDELESDEFEDKIATANKILKKKATPGRKITESDKEELREVIDSLPPMMKTMVEGSLEKMED